MSKYKFLAEFPAEVTRYVKLENCENGKIENCFDFSDLRHADQKGFEFMRVGENYDCKILLFGIAVDLFDEKTMRKSRFLCETTSRELLICETVDELAVGDRRVLQTTSGGNTYYVTIEDAADLKDKSRFVFRWSRKDIIQVDDIIHPAFLRH